MANFLVVDDEKQIRTMIKKALEEMGNSAETVANGEEALKTLFDKKYDGVFTDIRMPGMNGLDLLKAMKEENFNIPKVVISAYASVENVIEVFKLGARDFITKPFSPEEIKTAASTMQTDYIDIKETSQYVRGLIKQGATSSAEEYLSQLFAKYQSSPIPHYLKALIHISKLDKESAERHLKASLALDENYEPALKKLEEFKKQTKTESGKDVGEKEEE